MAKKRRRRTRDRERDEAAHDGPATMPSRRVAPEWQPPSIFARVAGAVFAVITFGIAAGVVVSAFSDELGPVDVGARLLAGLFLIGVGIVLAALSVAPSFVRKLFAGG